MLVYETTQRKYQRLLNSITLQNSELMSIDQMARTYSVKAASRRWPIQVFYNILDLAGINAWILFKEVTGNTNSHRNFLLQLATELSDPYITARGRAVTSVKRRKC